MALVLLCLGGALAQCARAFRAVSFNRNRRDRVFISSPIPIGFQWGKELYTTSILFSLTEETPPRTCPPKQVASRRLTIPSLHPSGWAPPCNPNWVAGISPRQRASRVHARVSRTSLRRLQASRASLGRSLGSLFEWLLLIFSNGATPFTNNGASRGSAHLITHFQ